MDTQPLVILAAGKGTRLMPLTAYRPKHLLRVYGKTIIEITLDNLRPYINKAIIVIGHQKDVFEAEMGHEYNGIPIEYVIQDEQKGTGHALHAAREAVNGQSFYAIYGDGIYMASHLESIAGSQQGIVGKRSDNWQTLGVLVQNEDGTLKEIHEKPETFVGNLVNIGVFKFDPDIFETFEEITPSPRGEYELTDMISVYARTHQIQVGVTDADWLEISYPWSLLSVAEYLAPTIEQKIEGTIEENVVIKGRVTLGKNAVIKSGTYIEGDCVIGENSEIGPNAYIRGFASIGNHCKVGSAVEIKNTIVGDNSKIPHLSYVGDSVIGTNANLSGGTITGSLRHDGQTVKSMVNGQLVDTGRKKFGTVIGDNAKTGIKTSIYPGRKIGADCTTLPGSVISEDVV